MVTEVNFDSVVTKFWDNQINHLSRVSSIGVVIYIFLLCESVNNEIAKTTLYQIKRRVGRVSYIRILKTLNVLAERNFIKFNVPNDINDEFAVLVRH